MESPDICWVVYVWACVIEWRAWRDDGVFWYLLGCVCSGMRSVVSAARMVCGVPVSDARCMSGHARPDGRRGGVAESFDICRVAYVPACATGWKARRNGGVFWYLLGCVCLGMRSVVSAACPGCWALVSGARRMSWHTQLTPPWCHDGPDCVRDGGEKTRNASSMPDTPTATTKMQVAQSPCVECP